VDGVTALSASHYVWSLRQQPVSVSAASDYTVWPQVSGVASLSVVAVPTATSPISISGLTGFSRYAAAVCSASPDRGASTGLLSAPATTVGITESTAQGTWTVTQSGGKYTIAVAVSVPSGPTFPWTGTATTQIYRLTSPAQAFTSGTSLGTVSSAYPTWSTVGLADSQKAVATPTAYYYVAVTTLTPAGFGGTSTTVKSCVLAPPANKVLVGTQPLVFSQW
jgi:hypothetical protein